MEPSGAGGRNLLGRVLRKGLGLTWCEFVKASAKMGAVCCWAAWVAVLPMMVIQGAILCGHAVCVGGGRPV